MALTSSYVLPTNRIPEIFAKIRDGQAPEHFSQQLLKDWGFTSSNDKAFIPLLKALGFLSSDGKPTQRYHDYRDHSKAKLIMGQAIREAYGDLFLIKEHPTTADKSAIEGKFKSFHNVSDHVATQMATTFFGLLALADLSASGVNTAPQPSNGSKGEEESKPEEEDQPKRRTGKNLNPTLHYNVQIHLPATKDVEVYNAIFKSLKDHLLAD